MKKLVGLFGLLALFVVPVVAQDSSTAPQDQAPTAPAAPTEPVKVKRTYPTPKYEISGGFTYRTYYGPNASTIGMKGGYASFDYNFFRWLGLEGEVVGVTGAIKIPNLPADDIRIFTALAGPKIYPLGHRKITPFGHFLYGAGINTTAIPAFSGYPGNSSAVAVQCVGGRGRPGLQSHAPLGHSCDSIRLRRREILGQQHPQSEQPPRFVRNRLPLRRKVKTRKQLLRALNFFAFSGLSNT